MSESPSEPVEIPWRQLSADALRGVVEAFVLREGTDYGEVEASFADKVQQVMRQLERAEAGIVFDPASETVDIVVTRRIR
ncbi:MAG: YheU family protein [Gammaproteobacteria bacterium]